MTKFELGEVAIMCNAKLRPHVNGWECTVVRPLRTYVVAELNRESHIGYVVEATDGQMYFQFPHQLRKKHPPGSDDAAARQAMLGCIERAKQPMGAPA